MKAIRKDSKVEVFFFDGTNASDLAHFLQGDIADINSYNGKRNHKVWILYGDNKTLYVHLDVNEEKVAIVYDGLDAYSYDLESFELQYEVI
ncbi:MAG: hypothetical protein AB7E61_06280 [Acholeplasmataceae bacterium]